MGRRLKWIVGMMVISGEEAEEESGKDLWGES